MFELLWDLHQQRRISETARDVGDVRSDTRETQRRVDDLQRQVDSLTLTCMAMWTLLKGKTGLSDQQLADRVREIDLRDGKLDGRITAPAQDCTSCGRVMSSRHRRCMSPGLCVAGPVSVAAEAQSVFGQLSGSSHDADRPA